MSERNGLPTGWAESTLGEIGVILSGYGFPLSLQGHTDGEIPFFKVGDISEAWKRGELQLDGAQHYLNADEIKSIRAKTLPNGTIVFAKIGAAISLNRRAILLRPSLVDNNVMGIWAEPNFVVTKYLFWYICTLRFGESSRASIVPSIRKSDVERVGFPLPPLSEQKRIVEKLEELLSDLDAGVAALERAQSNLKRYRAAVLKAAVEGRLTEKWRASHSPLAPGEGQGEGDSKPGEGYEPADKLLARILTERRHRWEHDQLARFAAASKSPPKHWQSKYKEPAKPDTADVLLLPKGWAVASLDQLTSTITSGSRDWTKYYGTGSGTFIMAQNVRPAKLDLSYRQPVDPPLADRDRVRSEVQRDDLLVTIVGANTGDVCRVDRELTEHYVCQSVALMRPVEKPLSQFVEMYMAAEFGGQRHFRRYIYGQGRPHLGFDEIRMTPVVLPSVEEQRIICGLVDERMSALENAEEFIRTSLRRAARLRQSILKRAFEGKLVPQDPADESAAALLDRIRATRVTKSSGRRSSGPRKRRDKSLQSPKHCAKD